jgi:Family of unknown function (DUF6188)
VRYGVRRGPLGLPYPYSYNAAVAALPTYRLPCGREDASKDRSYAPAVGAEATDPLKALVGLEIDQVWVWWELRLVFEPVHGSTRDTYLDTHIFEFTDPDGLTHHVNVASNPVGVGKVLSVLHERVADVSEDNGTLCLSFTNGARLMCPPDPDGESWVVSLPDALFMP